ncbi:hypothetical protein [Streptomyces sp. NPDC015125]|uniref:hypothetical protein n=1 Tax=Streptomyces sp. NPDC015125 TaxID=3364938 RepID=UPI0036FF495E
MRFIINVITDILLITLVVRAFGMRAKQEWGQLTASLFGCAVLAGCVCFPQPMLDIAKRLLETLVGHTDGHTAAPHPSPHPQHPDHSTTPTAVHLPWETLTACAVTVAVLAALTITARSLQRYTRRRARERTRRAETEGRHDRVLDAYAAFTTDVLAVLDRPALADVTVPETERLIRSLDAAREARIDRSDGYRSSVQELELAWKAADRHARKQGTALLPPNERRAVQQARRLLTTALGISGNAHERHLAYRRAMRLIEPIVDVPSAAVAALTAGALPSLPPAPCTRTVPDPR